AVAREVIDDSVRRDAPYLPWALDVNGTIRANSDSAQDIELRIERGPAVARVAEESRTSRHTGDRADDAVRRDLAYELELADVERAVLADRDGTILGTDRRRRRRAAVAGVARDARARDRRDEAERVDAANAPAVLHFLDIERAVGANRQSLRTRDACQQRRP